MVAKGEPNMLLKRPMGPHELRRSLGWNPEYQNGPAGEPKAAFFPEKLGAQVLTCEESMG